MVWLDKVGWRRLHMWLSFGMVFLGSDLVSVKIKPVTGIVV